MRLSYGESYLTDSLRDILGGLGEGRLLFNYRLTRDWQRRQDWVCLSIYDLGLENALRLHLTNCRLTRLSCGAKCAYGKGDVKSTWQS